MTVFTAASATVLTVVPSPAHASVPSAAAKGTWRVSLHTSAGTTATTTVATSKRTAWTFTTNDQGSKARAFHLSGGRWRASALPRTVDSPVIEAAASSDRNVWAATMGELPAPPAASVNRLLAERPALRSAAAAGVKRVPARVLRWNGRSWTTMKSFPGTTVTAIAAPGARDVRIFGMLMGKGDPTAIMWRYNGKTWKRTVTKTMVTGVAVRSSRDIWAAAFETSDDGHEVILHFDGRSWRRERLPLPSGEVNFSGITAGRDRVWVTGDGITNQTYAFVRDRRGWRRERIPGATDLGPRSRPFLTDRGELAFITMLVSENTPPAYRERAIMFYRKSTGKWHVDVVPQKLAGRGFEPWGDTAPLRGSGTILVGGSLTGSRASEAAVAVYRPNH
ncbi:hypothetical protein [Actinomadura oligospora]|uniref:hypothetical protein n=1 Tax=Actinomadura oligospora TaxID=111804 RepID=UPI0012F76980|nr:hypothetical protein [Actinomadura oligospora]